MEPSPVLPELTPQCWSHVFSQLPARDTARAACVHKLWRDLVHNDEQLWKRFMLEDLGLSAKVAAGGDSTATYRLAYWSWRDNYGPEYWPYLARAIQAWTQVKEWLAVHCPAVRQSIEPGLTESEVSMLEADLGFSLPPAMKVLYRLHDGQRLKWDVMFDRKNTAAGQAAAAATTAAGGGAAAAAAFAGMVPGIGAFANHDDDEEEDPEAEASSIFHGMFGGYSVYDHTVVTRMMPLRRAALWRAELQLHTHRPHLLPFACSFRVSEKMFVADAATGNLAILRRGQGTVRLQPAVPPGPPDSDTKDGVLRWFEEYARRLAAGWYEVAPLDESFPDDSQAICLYPLAPPAMVEAVTKGVRVRASVVYIPEAHPTRDMFTYSIRFALLDSRREPAGPLAASTAAYGSAAAGGGAAAATDSSEGGSGGFGAGGGGGLGWVQQCQLMTRHWVIRGERGEVVEEVNGEGVIGKYPVLRPGEPDFVYSSCTHQRAGTCGAMEGEFRFVEGTIERRTGPTFDVVCPAFRLDVPPYTF